MSIVVTVPGHELYITSSVKEMAYLEAHEDYEAENCTCSAVECVVHEKFRCNVCRKLVNWSLGCDDDLPGACDNCWVMENIDIRDSIAVRMSKG